MKKWIGGIILVLAIVAFLGFRSGDWIALETIGTWLLASTVFFAILQAYEARRSTNAQITGNFYQHFRSDEMREKLRHIYALQPDEVEQPSNEQVREIESVIDYLDMLAALVLRGIVDRDLAIEAFGGPPVLRCWYKLCSYIQAVRAKRGAYYATRYEALARLTLDYFRTHNIELKFYHWAGEDKAEQTVDIIAELQKRDCAPRSVKELTN